MRSLTPHVVAIALLAASVGLAADPAWYAKKATWQETLAASREALARHEAQRRPQAEKPGTPVLSPWRHIGAFTVANKSAFGEAFPPEQGIDLTKAYGNLRWSVHPEWVDGRVYDLQTPGNSATYLYRTITSPIAQAITGYFGSDDGMALWLNGKQILARDVPRGAGPNQDTVKLELKAGENQLLFKIHNQSGGCGFYFSTRAEEGARKSPEQIAREELWSLVQRDFTDGASIQQMKWERQDGIWAQDWPAGDAKAIAQRYVSATRGNLAEQARNQAASADLAALRKLYHRSRFIEEARARVQEYNTPALRLAIQDLAATYGQRYPNGAAFLQRLDAIEKTLQGLPAQAGKGADDDRFMQAVADLDTLRREALLANPLIDFDKLMMVKRREGNLGLPQNWQGNCALPRSGYEDELVTLSPVRTGAPLTTMFRPEKPAFVGDVELHPAGGKLLYSSIGPRNRWHVFEMDLATRAVRQVTPDENEVDWYDPCYLPDGRIIVASTAAFHGVPCVGGGNTVANLYRMDADGKNIRQLSFDQDHNWCPTVMNDGRILYTRWEYSDTAHYFTRILFQMNPDGTNQMALYGSNSYWPNSIFYARPIPNHPTKVVAVISGHHGVPRMGELVVFDPGKGRHESDGALQRIPGHAKVVPPTIADTLVDGSWPKFLHPYPLSDKHFLVSMQPNPQSSWGVYLVDNFDNMVLICEQPGYAMLEPVPLRKTAAAPVIPDRIKPDSREATVYLSDVYSGPGLKGVPRGTVKKLRIYEIHYAYPGMGGHINIGIDGPWDVHRIVGTVPVNEDGSAAFTVPANTPLAAQPLDEEGRAVQVMRSWFTAMPGEVLSCAGCHEQQSDAPPARTMASYQKPSPITPWYGPARGFSFKREVQPVLDQYCVGCHNGQPYEGKATINLARSDKNGDRNFTPSYLELHRFVRRPGPESDYRLQQPLEWHASTSELVQMLKKGHYNVKLDAEAWDRLYTWIDLNVPDHGTWTEHRGIPGKGHERRLELRTRYANRPEDPEAIVDLKQALRPFVKPAPLAAPAAPLALAGWPFDANEAKKRQAGAGLPAQLKVELAPNLALDLVLVPAGSFVMGSPAGAADEAPQAVVRIDKPCYVGAFEVTNAQFALFDPSHDSGYISVFNKDQSSRGEPANRERQPVIRVTWQQAMAYCDWLSRRTGKKFTLPTEAQWEYAARAGAGTSLFYGDAQADFSKFANLADERLNALARGDSPKWIPALMQFNDGAVVTDNVGGRYKPNAWGLFDVHGNVAEWTRSTYRPYPYNAADGRDNPVADGLKVVRGGSFYDRPARATSSARQAYPGWQRVFNVGFRVVCEVDAPAVAGK